MVTITLYCPHCQSDALVRNGHAPNGKQLYRCRTCGRQSRETPTPHAYPQDRRDEIQLDTVVRETPNVRVSHANVLLLRGMQDLVAAICG